MENKPNTGAARQRSRSTSATRTEHRAREQAAPPARDVLAPPRAGPAPRGPQPPVTPAAASRGGPPSEDTPHRAARPPSSRSDTTAPQQAMATYAAADTRSAASTQLTPSVPLARRPIRSPKSDLESDYIIVHRLLKSNLISGDLARDIAMSLTDRQRALDEANVPTPNEEELQAARDFAALTPIPQTAPTAALKRQRTETDLPPCAASTKQPRVSTLIDEPLPPRERDPRIRSRTTATATPRVVTMDTAESSQGTPDVQRPSTSFADVARGPPPPAAGPRPRSPPPAPGPQPSQPAAGSQPQPPAAAAAKMKTPRYPPLIVESLPTWAYHLRAIKNKLGRTPNARPFGKGIKFIPQEDQEYRLIQRYLTELEKSEKISWFSYSLPQDRSLKVAIRGIPVETDPVDIEEELRSLGFEAEVVRPIKARKGRPGCIFFAVLKRTPNLIPDIYRVTELLCMPGVHIEAWRGKKGPAQCHRCQKFRHSSHGCHRKQACVRCGEEHSAHECPRPREEPATCANCGGPHPANNISCPVFRREARNKRAGTVAATTATGTGQTEDPRPRPRPQPQRSEEDESAARQGASNLRTEANDPTPRGSKLKGKKKKKKPSSKKKEPAPERPLPAEAKPAGKGSPNDRKEVLEAAIQTLSDVLLALRAGDDPIDVVLRGMSVLLKLNG